VGRWITGQSEAAEFTLCSLTIRLEPGEDHYACASYEGAKSTKGLIVN
jgi:hypothetical protein